MLTQQQRECLEMLIVGTKTTTEIAKEIGVSRETVSKWKNRNEEFKRELDKRSRQFETGLIDEAESLLKRTLGQAVGNIIEIANNPKNKEETRLKASQYLVDRVLGNTTTKIEQTNDDKAKDKEPINIDEVLENIKKQSEKSGNK